LPLQGIVQAETQEQEAFMSAASVGPRTSTRNSAPLRYGSLLLALAAAVAFALTTWRYFTPLSGVNGTGGALLTMFGEAVLAIAALVIGRMTPGAGRNTLLTLAWIGIVLTTFAATLLQGWLATAALGVAIIGLLIETTTRQDGSL
jgi:hypothetical protein